MHLVASFAPPNSLVLVMDRSVGRVPDAMDGGLVAATPSCVAVGTLSEHDGVTQFTLGDEPVQIANDELVFDGTLDTPGLKLGVCSVLNDVILEMPVDHPRTRVQVWANDPAEPNDIRILVCS
jgi:hypothetical protein